MRNLKTGYLASFGYVVTTLLSIFCVENLISTFHNKFFVLFMACFISTTFFSMLNYKNFSHISRSISKSWALYIGLALLIGLNWVNSIFGVVHSNAFLYAMGYFLFSSSLAHLDNYWQRKNRLSGILCLLSWLVLLLAELLNAKLTEGILIALLGGASGYLYRRITAKFSQAEHLTSTQILSVRFYPLLLLLSFKFHVSDVISVTAHQWIIIIGFSILAFVIPNYLNQVAIIKIGANRSAILSALIFPASWIIEEILHGFVKINANLLLAIAAMLIILTPLMLKRI